MSRLVLLSCFWLLVAGLGCSDDESNTPADAHTDANSWTDGDTDGGTEADAETGDGAVADTDTDAGLDCTGTETFCALSCSLDDVQKAADDAMASGIQDTKIVVPACDPNPYPWASGSKLVLVTDPTKNIRLIGSGKDSTEIVNFQIDVPNSEKLNLVELGHMSLDGNDETPTVVDERLKPETLHTELYWHDLRIKNYTATYTLTFEGWFGLISNIEMWCEDRGERQNPYGITVHGDGVYSDHSVDFGTRNAIFIEDSRFDNCSHTISSFCDGYVVFRHNTVTRADSYTDLHGPGYNYCYYNSDEQTAGGGYEVYDNEFIDSQGNWVVSARAGQGHIITNNHFDNQNYQILLYWDSSSTRHGNDCGTDTGETCDRCYTVGCNGCCQAQEKTYIWNNDGSVIEYLSKADDCLIVNDTYFLRSPNEGTDGFSWTPFTYPHPLRNGG